MIVQLLIGGGLMVLVSITVGLLFWVIEAWLDRIGPWLVRPPHRPRMLLALGLLTLGAITQSAIAVWLWALLFLALGLFSGVEPAVYFALVAFTTLGFGDILLPEDWRLLGGLAAANGLLNFGLLTAVLVESLRELRRSQLEEANGS